MREWSPRNRAREEPSEDNVVECLVNPETSAIIVEGIITGLVIVLLLAASSLVPLHETDHVTTTVIAMILISEVLSIIVLLPACSLRQFSYAVGHVFVRARIKRMSSIRLGDNVTACDVVRLSLASFFISSLTWADEESLLLNARNAIKYLLSRDFIELIESVRKVDPQTAKRLLELINGRDHELRLLNRRLFLLMLKRDLLLLVLPLGFSMLIALAIYMSIWMMNSNLPLLLLTIALLLTGVILATVNEITGGAWEALSSVRQLGIHLYHELRKAIAKLRLELRVPVALVVWAPGLKPSRDTVVIYPTRYLKTNSKPLIG